MKKVLAWAVALALVLSSFTMAFADQTKTSADFKDADQIHYNEAVDVMVATGVINGYPDGTFGPAKTVKRSEMAKMIAVMMNGGEDVGNQYKSACPFKDSKDHWAAGYIAYCATEHIIDGRSADVFDPEAEVTGTEVAKMALTSLGYDSKIQGYTGETWAAAVLKDAKKVGLFEGLDKSFVPGDPCNRESAAQILFNALQANEVDYPANISVNTGDAEVNVNSGIRELGPLYKDVFGKSSDATLEKKTGDAAQDDFGRPGHAWKCEGDDVGTYSDPVDYEFTAEKTTVPEAIEAYDKELAKTLTTDKYNFTTKYNGKSEGTLALGDKVELYVTEAPEGSQDGTKGTVEVIVVQYKPAQITKVDTKKISKEEAEKGITAKLTLDGSDAVKNVEANNTMAGYDASTYVQDAVIAVAIGQKDGKAAILDSYVPEELAKGAITEIDKTTQAATISGKQYEKATAFEPFGGNLVVKGEYTVYDYSGYMFASVKDKAPVAEVFYGLVTANKDKKPAPETIEPGTWSDAQLSAEKAMVKVLTPEGKTETLTLADDVSLPAVEALVKYELNADGEISKITVNNETLGTGEPVKTGDVLYGKQLTKNVTAFANINEGKKDDKGKNLPAEWKIYNLDALKAAKAIDVTASFEEEAGLVAMKVKSLEEAVEPDTVLAFYTKATAVENATGDAYKIDVFENGKAKTYTTVGSGDDSANPKAEYTAIASYISSAKTPAELVKLTFDGDLVKKIEPAKCIGQTAPASEFKIDGKDYDAVFYGADYLAYSYYYKVNGISGQNLNVWYKDDIKNQTVDANAVVYYINEKGELEESDFDSIEEGNCVILMQLDKAKTWDTVFFTDQAKFTPNPQNPDQTPA